MRERVDRTQFRFLADLGRHDEQAREALFARIEKLVDEVRFDLRGLARWRAAIPRRMDRYRGPAARLATCEGPAPDVAHLVPENGRMLASGLGRGRPLSHQQSLHC